MLPWGVFQGAAARWQLAPTSIPPRRTQPTCGECAGSSPRPARFPPRAFDSAAQNTDALASKKISFERANALAESSDELLIRDAAHLHVISSVEMSLGRKHTRRPFRIVRQQQQTFAGLVQASDRSHPGQRLIQQVIHSLAALLIASRGHHTARLVHHQAELGCRCDCRTVDFNLVPLQLDRGFRITLNRPIDSHASRPHKLKGLGTRTIPQLGKRPCQADSPAGVFGDHIVMLNDGVPRLDSRASRLCRITP